MMNLEGQTALITGAGRGIGRTISVKLAESGADIVLVDMSPDVAEVRGEVEALGRKCMTFEVDVTNIETIDAMVKNITDELSGIHILVNNAGITQDNLFLRMKSEQWSKVIDVNLNGVFNVTKAVIRLMVKQRTGKIINISSVHGLRASEYKTAYVAAKHGVIGMTKVMALEGANHNITCNAICPGYVKTPLVEGQIKDQAKAHDMSEEEVVEKVMLRKQAVKEFVPLKAIADMALLLAKDSSTTITGTSFALDGGWSAQ